MSGSSIFGQLAGTVSSFDDPRGIGVVRADDGREFGFHCTAIADDTRTIEEGRSVTFEVAAGQLGQWQARAISPR